MTDEKHRHSFPKLPIKKQARNIHAILVGLSLLVIASIIEIIDHKTGMTPRYTLESALIMALVTRAIGILIRHVSSDKVE